MDRTASDRNFLVLVLFLLVGAGVLFSQPLVAMWFGFILAGYSVIANDSIQTIGTFLASNKNKKWYVLWLYLGGIFILTTLNSWLNHNGDVSYGRLATKGLEQSPEEFNYLQLAAPIFLIIVTYLRMPVSTTFLILSSFAKKSSTIGKILLKSLTGYFIAFFSSLILWPLIKKLLDKYGAKKPHRSWIVVQWVISGLLWAAWFMQDAANIAVYLPRQLSLVQLIAFMGVIFFGMGLLIYFRGGGIQSIVKEKVYVDDVRHATAIDTIYALILYYFKIQSKIPMSTTWVFLGNIGGRELAMSAMGCRSMKKAKKMVFRDITYAVIGLVISFFIALGVNDHFKAVFLGW